MYRFWGYEPGEISVDLDSVAKSTHIDDLPVLETAVSRLLQGDDVEMEYRRYDKLGREIFIYTNGQVIRNEAGEAIGVFGIDMDITKRKQQEQHLLDLNRLMEAKNKELEQLVVEANAFTYVASHDLQEPLRKIRTFTELVQQNIHDRDFAEKYFTKIHASAHRMSELIRSVLAYSRISKDNTMFERVNLNDVLKSVVSDFELLIEEKGAKVIYDNLPNVTGISVQLGQLFSNLVSNGLKFSVVEPVIRITARRLTENEISLSPELVLADYYEICVTDNGIGFDQQYEKKIFNMFQRLHRKEQYAGTGIGLALCKKIVESHHGTISAKSTPGEGTSFCVTLPAAYDSISTLP